MLDSLVRVSRRVGGAADLLATEMPAAPARALGIQADSGTPRPGRQERGARQGQVPNELHPRPRSPAKGSSREAPEKCSRGPGPPKRGALAGRQLPSGRDPSLNLRGPLREPLRLPLHSFTYC